MATMAVRNGRRLCGHTHVKYFQTKKCSSPFHTRTHSCSIGGIDGAHKSNYWSNVWFIADAFFLSFEFHIRLINWLPYEHGELSQSQWKNGEDRLLLHFLNEFQQLKWFVVRLLHSFNGSESFCVLSPLFNFSQWPWPEMWCFPRCFCRFECKQKHYWKFNGHSIVSAWYQGCCSSFFTLIHCLLCLLQCFRCCFLHFPI